MMVHSSWELAEFAVADEQALAGTVAVLPAGLFVFGGEPDAGGDLGVGEELTRKSEHALDEVGLDQGATDVAFAVV
jgi:hypothetical protein